LALAGAVEGFLPTILLDHISSRFAVSGVRPGNT
jgi:hypothetical protein